MFRRRSKISAHVRLPVSPAGSDETLGQRKGRDHVSENVYRLLLVGFKHDPPTIKSLCLCMPAVSLHLVSYPLPEENLETQNFRSAFGA